MSRIALLLVFLNVLHGGLTLRCYECEVDKNPNCTIPLSGTVPQVECNQYNSIPFAGASLSSFAKYIAPKNSENIDSKTDEYQCMTLSAWNGLGGAYNVTIIGRTCARTNLTCKKVVEEGIEYGFANVSCFHCSWNLCNATPGLVPTGAALTAVLVLIFKELIMTM